MKSRILTCITVMTLFAVLVVPVRLAAQADTAQGNQSKPRHYKLIDLGTLGGPASYFPGAPPVSKVLNNQGAFAGDADTTTPDPFPSACFNPDCFVSHAFRWQNSVLTDLGALATGWSSAANWISETGLIVGISQNGLIDPSSGGTEVHAVLWKDGQIIDLGTLGGNASIAAGVNSRGQIVGAATNTIPDPFSIFGVGTQTRAFLWQDGVMRDLGTLGGPDAFAQVINERGQVAGNSYTSYTAGPGGSPQVDSFLWHNGKMTDLGGLGGTSSTPNDLNNRGQVVGVANLAGDLTSHPFLWDRGVLTDLGTLGGNNGQATGLNDDREVVGYADLPGSTSHHAFLWKNDNITDLGVLAGFSCSAAWFINSKGQIVGHSHDCVAASDAVLWENGGPPVDLNTLIPSGSTLHLQDALNINDRGEIAGFGVPTGCAPQDFSRCGHAYVLIPCGEGDEGCEDNAEGAAATQNSPAPATPRSTTTTPANPALSGRPATIQDRLRSRWGQRYHFPGSGTRPIN